jgi:hypothetical protein
VHQNKSAGLKGRVLDGLLKGVLELLCRLEATLEDVGVYALYGGKVVLTLLELVCSDCDQVNCVESRGDVWNEKGGKYDVEREDWFNAVSHVEGGVTSQFASRDTICPKCVRCGVEQVIVQWQYLDLLLLLLLWRWLQHRSGWGCCRCCWGFGRHGNVDGQGEGYLL